MADLSRQLHEWQLNGVIEPDLSQPNSRVSSLLFPVPKKDSIEFRWCNDLRYVNDWLKNQSIKYETVESVRQMIRKNDYLTSIDLKSAYSHVQIHPSHRHLLGFDALGRRWRCRALPFGLSVAPYVFTRLMRTVVGYLRNLGVRVSIYLDDILVMADSRQKSLMHTQFVLEVLAGLGFVINRSKSSLEPAKVILHLGLLFDSYRWRITLPESKLLNIAKDARRVLRANASGTLTIRMIAGLAGKLGAAIAAIPEARFRMRSMQRLVWYGLRHKKAWTGTVSLSATSLRDVAWSSMTKVLRRSNHGKIRVAYPDAVLSSDASETGWGATLEVDGRLITTFGHWNPSESAWSSNLRETTAITRSVLSFQRRLRQCRSILFRTDNITAMAALNRCGSSYRHLGLAIEPVLRFVFRHRIFVRAVHLPGCENGVADALSRLTPLVNQWHLSHSATMISLELLRRSLPMIQMIYSETKRDSSRKLDFVDWFASAQHHLVPTFASRIPEPEASFVDAMQHSWTDHVGIWVPPLNLIPKVLSKIIDDQAHGLVVVPFWPTRPWYGTIRSIAIRSPTFLPPESYQAAVGLHDQLRPPPSLVAFVV